MANTTASQTASMSCWAQPGWGRDTVVAWRTTTTSVPSSSYPTALIIVVPASTQITAMTCLLPRSWSAPGRGQGRPDTGEPGQHRRQPGERRDDGVRLVELLGRRRWRRLTPQHAHGAHADGPGGPDIIVKAVTDVHGPGGRNARPVQGVPEDARVRLLDADLRSQPHHREQVRDAVAGHRLQHVLPAVGDQ